ncbi:unnamed protein product [Cladocopium goreaui]|uniref:Uncharacterized protein n=1 Tax=Cladocopium goreaui TaxID=2562237 RepID=A0A9P1CNZ6_9DINO|nr:unnamed protein product [Cladocopium goreaui]
MPGLSEEDILGLWRLRSLLHELKSSLFEALSRGEKCVLKLVVGSSEVSAIDAACSSIVRACHEHLKICKLEREGLKDLPMHLSPVMPMTAEQFDGSELKLFLSKLGLGYDVLLFLDSIEEVLCSVRTCPLKNTSLSTSAVVRTMALSSMTFHDGYL